MLSISFPTEINIGSDATVQLARRLKGKAVLIVSGGERTVSSALYKRMIEELELSASSLETFVGVSSNPDSETINRGVVHARGHQLDAIVSVGGGSVHDAAKLIAILSRQELKVEDCFVEVAGYTRISSSRPEVYCLPSLAGTGAEISPASLVRHNEKKRIAYSPFLFPVAAYYDVDLMKIDGSDDCLFTGLDAFVQSLEAFVSTKANLWSDMYARSGLENSVYALSKLAAGEVDESTKNRLILSSLQGLRAVSNSSVGAIHALSDPLSGIFDMHHGRALAVLASSVVRENAKTQVDKYTELHDLLSGSLGRRDLGNVADSVEAFLCGLVPGKIEELRSDIAKRMKDLQVSVDRLAAESFNPDMDGNPRQLDEEAVKAILRSSVRDT